MKGWNLKLSPPFDTRVLKITNILVKGWSLKLSLQVCTDAKIRNPKNKSYHFPLLRLQFQMQQLKQETCQKADDDVD